MKNKISADDIKDILPKKLRGVCQVGICNPAHLEKKERVFCLCPVEHGGPRWSAKPSEVLPSVKAIITLLFFDHLASDYLSLESNTLLVADRLWRRLRIGTHVLDRLRRPNAKNIVGREASFLRSSGYDAKKKMILFKDIAYYAGLGQYGKNSLIINRSFGTDFKIQALFTDTPLEYDKPILPKAYPGCKDCNICIEACPAKIIRKYKVISKTDVCARIVTDKPIVIGRIPKMPKTWNDVSTRQKLYCRICQSFCPLNSQNYQNRLILASKENKKYTLFYSAGIPSSKN